MYREHANTRQEVVVVGAIFSAFVVAAVIIAAGYAAVIRAGLSL